MRKSADKMGCGLAGSVGSGCVFVLITVLVSASTASASGPIMNVQSTASIGDYDPSHPGNELMIIYHVSNDSEESEANWMLDFSVSAGTDNGIYKAITENSGWSVQPIGVSSTKFNSGPGSAVLPGDDIVFRIYSTNLYTASGLANATANDPGLEFAPVLVDVPGDLHTLAGDISGDGIVDANDVGMMAENWLAEEAGNVADISAGGRVDFVDFALLANDWGKQEPWYVGE